MLRVATAVAAAVSAFLPLVQATYRTIHSPLESSHKIRIKDLSAGVVCKDGVPSHPGWVDIGDHHIFYWLFESRHESKNAPTMVWFSGGPGGSSMFGAFAENGDCLVDPTSSTGAKLNPYAWTELFNVVYIDQPVGVGLSYVDNASNHHTFLHSTGEAALDVVQFLKLLQLGFPQYAQNDIYLAGESFAGHYVPAYANYVLEFNKLMKEIGEYDQRIPLSSLVLVSPWIDPGIQLPSIYDVACYSYQQYPSSLNESVCANMTAKIDKCEVLIGACGSLKPADAVLCMAAGEYCDSIVTDVVISKHTNKYDRRMKCPEVGECYPEADEIVSWMNSKAVFHDLLEVKAQSSGCVKQFDLISFNTFTDFRESGDIWINAAPHIQSILDVAGIPVLVSAGDADLLVTSKGTLETLSAIRWKQRPVFRNTLFKNLSTKHSSHGEALPPIRTRKVEGLWFAEIAEAGHVTPLDQPENMLRLMELWLEYVSSKETSHSCIDDYKKTKTQQQRILEVSQEL